MILKKMTSIYLVLQIIVVFFNLEIHRIEHHLYFKHHSFKISHIIGSILTASDEESLDNSLGIKKDECIFWKILFYLSTQDSNNYLSIIKLSLIILLLLALLLYRYQSISLDNFFCSNNSRAPPFL